MAYPAVGKFIGYKVDGGLNFNDASRAKLVNNVLPAQTASAVAPIYKQGSSATTFIEEKPPWSFTFLKYVAGAAPTGATPGAGMTGRRRGWYFFTISARG